MLFSWSKRERREGARELAKAVRQRARRLLWMAGALLRDEAELVAADRASLSEQDPGAAQKRLAELVQLADLAGDVQRQIWGEM